MLKKLQPGTRSIVLLTLPLFMVFAIGLACKTPGGSAPTATDLPSDAVNTAAAQTVRAQLTMESGDQVSPEAPAGAPPTETPLPQGPDNTPTVQSTVTPAFTPTLAIPKIKADVNTNCRRGPSKLYDPPVGVLYKDQESEVHGKNAAGTWWYILDPQSPGNYCWVWAETTRVEGNIASLTIITPPPPPPTATFTPTPGLAFTASYEDVHDCGGNPTAIFKITNTGGLKLESMRLEIKDLTASATLFGPNSSDAPYMGTSGECPPGGDVLNSGKTLYVGGAIGAGNSGHDARAKIKLCTENGLGGTCAEKTVDFSIP